VALGAASFVVFSALYPDEVSPTRVAAQVVSGIGFLGAGIIFRDGFNVHGLNTAATLWCSAAVGMFAGAGALTFAALLTGLVVFINLGLRPFVKWLKRTTRAGVPVLRQFRVMVRCPTAREAEVRALMIRTLGMGGLHLSEIERTVAEAAGEIELVATLSGEGLAEALLEQAVTLLASEPGLARVRWELLEDA
jgi:putative Mg2+ transporter-C (MgtC) family protein